MFHFKMINILLIIQTTALFLISTSNCHDVSSKLDYFLYEIFINKNIKNENTTTTTTAIIDQFTNEIISLNKKDNNTTEEDITFIDYYYKGISAYSINDWESCINHIERSLILYNEFYELITSCRLGCENERKQYVSKYLEDYENRKFYESLIYKTLCMEKCKKLNLPNISKYFMLSDKEKDIFTTRKPYEYLQICYYRDKEIEKAFSAAYTALVGDPLNSVLQKNLQFYSKMKQFDFNKLQDYQEKRYSSIYQDAFDKYSKEEWGNAIELFEYAIDIWIQELEKCRVFCEGEYDHGWLPEFTTAISNHYVYTLRCKRNCTLEMSLVNGRYVEDLLPTIYDYLQYSYYKNGNLKEACRCVSSYLLFIPNSENMLHNRNFYKNLADVYDSYFELRPEAKTIYYRSYYEQDLLKDIDEEFSKLLEEDIPPIEIVETNKNLTQQTLEKSKNDDVDDLTKNVPKEIENDIKTLIKEKFKNKSKIDAQNKIKRNKNSQN